LGDEWVLVVCLIVTTAAVRATGPIVLGGRELPGRAMNVVTLLAPALLAALVATETFRGEDDDSSLTLDERALGLAAAGAALALRGGIIVAGAAALLVTAGARAIL